MSLYDEENPLLLQRPRPFWEEEEPVVAPVVVQPVAPVAAPPPEVEGPGYASPEDIAAIPEVEGPGFASAQEIPSVEPPEPEVEGPGYASLEEIPGAQQPSILGDIGRGVYRALAAPLLEPVETARRATEALREGVVAPEGTRRREFVERLKRNSATAMEETKAGWRQAASGFLSAEQNPYVSKSVEQAKADISLLEQQIADTEKSLTAFGGDPKLVGQEFYFAGDLTPEQREQSQKLGVLQQQLARAKEASTGVTKESYAGALSRSFADVAADNRTRKEEIVKEYGEVIDKSRDKELWMQVADSLGSSAPSMGASMLNPVFGLSLMYAQTFETARSEFLEKGGDPAKADEVGHTQAALQTPLEILGEVPVAGIAKGALKRLAAEANPESWAKWIGKQAVELSKAFAGEVGVTTPGQTVIEQKVGEKYGYKPKKTGAELAKDVFEAQKVAALQTLLAGGGPIAAEAGVRGVAGVGAAPVAAAPGVPVAPAVPPPIPPTPAEAFAPPPGVQPGVTITPAPGEVPVPPDLAGAPPPGVPPPTGDERFAPPSVLPPVAPGAPPTVEVGPRTPAGDAVTQVVGKQNAGVTQVASEKAETLQAANAPKTADAIQQVARASNVEASVTAAEYLQQAKQQQAEAAAEAVAEAAKAAEAAAPAEAAPAAVPTERPYGQPPPLPVEPTEAAPQAAPQPAVPAPAAQPEQHAVVVGGQVFTGPTQEDAVRSAYGAVGGDAMNTAETGWVNPGTGRFVSHDIYDAHLALNTAMEQAGGNEQHPAVQQAQAQLAEAEARDVEVNSQIVTPGGEQVVQTGVKGQEALVATRPSQELAVPLAGVNATVSWTDTEGRTATAQRPAAQALNEARNDRTALTILLNCLT